SGSSPSSPGSSLGFIPEELGESQPATSVDLDFLEDDILGSPAGGAAALPTAEQPCDILQQSLQEANITEQTLEAEAELDLGSFQLPTLQPVVQAASDGTPQIFSGGADLIGLQQPAVLTHQALVQQPVGADVVNKAISVQPFLQQVGLGNVTIQPISNLQGLPNGSPGGTLGIAPIQVVGQQVMAINQPAQQIIAKQVQPSPVSAGLVIQKNLPAVATTTLNGSSMFGGVAGAPASQPLTVTSNLSSPLVQAQNVIIHRTPTPIQPKPAGVLQQKLYQITPKPFQQKAQQNLTFMAGKAGQNVVLSGFPQGLPANVFKQPPPQQPALSKPMSVHLLNQGSSIVIPAQHVPQAVLQGQNQFLLPGQLAGASAVQLPQQLSALPANMGGQILTASHPSGQAHIITSPGPGGQLIANQALPAQILTNQNIAGQLNLGQVLTSQNAHGTAHILSAPIQLQPGQVGQPAQPAVAASLPGGAIGQPGQTVIQGVTLPSQVAMLNAAENLGPAVSIQPSAAAASSQSPGLVQPQPASAAGLLPGAEQPSILTVQAAPQPPQAREPEETSHTTAQQGGLVSARGGAGGGGDTTKTPRIGLRWGKSVNLQPKKGASRGSPARFVAAAGAPRQLGSSPFLSSFLEQLHKHQGAVLHPDYKTSFRSFEDALQRLLPYHVYQGMLPSAQDYRKVDEEFEVVSAQLLKRTQAMLNKYRLLLLEESRRVSPSAEMVMIDRMFIQEEKTMLALDKQLAKEKPGWERAPPPVCPPPITPCLFDAFLPLQRPDTALPHDARSLVLQDGAAPQKSDDSTSGLMKELAEVEDEFYRGMIKTEPPDHGAGSELTWEVPLPPAKRRKSESFDVDNASFSSDSPQDDSLNEHLQSAIDSILNLQQPQTGGQSTRTPSSSYNSSSSPFSSPVHRTDTYLAPSHNGGLGARTLNR
uniref:BRD4 interacting chromatin remodeling complex associated protein n=1 Tax=Anser cygnoides TaxID=8845 RepID=A0A8B9EAZ5_ANSCY